MIRRHMNNIARGFLFVGVPALAILGILAAISTVFAPQFILVLMMIVLVILMIALLDLGGAIYRDLKEYK